MASHERPQRLSLAERVAWLSTFERKIIGEWARADARAIIEEANQWGQFAAHQMDLQNWPKTPGLRDRS